MSPAIVEPGWPRDDLVRRIGLALDIAQRSVVELGHSGYADDDMDDGNSSFGPDKPLAETAMLLHVVAGSDAGPATTARVAAIDALLLPLARSPRVACGLALYPSIGPQLAMPHVLLNRRGHADAQFDRLLSESLRSLAAGGREVVPHRRLEALWLAALWNDTSPGPGFDAAAADSVLHHPLDLIWGARDDAYAFTHAVMYFSDFGQHFGLPPRALPRPAADIATDAEAVLARALLLEDFDLAAETLMIWPQLGLPFSPAAAFGFAALARLEDRVGFLPARNGIPEKFGRLSGDARTRYALAAAYHTAYVMGMLCTLALRRPPPVVLAGSAADTMLDQLLGAIPPADTPWRAALDALPPDGRGGLAPFLLDMALLANARAQDFAGVARLLHVAAASGLADRPLCAQSVQLLERMAIAVTG